VLGWGLPFGLLNSLGDYLKYLSDRDWAAFIGVVRLHLMIPLLPGVIVGRGMWRLYEREFRKKTLEFELPEAGGSRAYGADHE